MYIPPLPPLQVSSTFTYRWNTAQYPDFVALGSSDQMTIMEAICTVKEASFDGVDCVGENDAATGTVRAPSSVLLVLDPTR